ncbi:MAG: hypothetical protein GY724_05590 [Actinomycetia bacterium]|nr:hypothetical protein [Actinomycetes bacterium]
MAARPTHQRRLAMAALLICFVAATILVTLSDDQSDQDAADQVGQDSVTPVGAGVSHAVASAAEWDTAVAAASPGDIIRLTASINARLVYRGDNDGGTATGLHGTAAAPIVITADPGVWIDPGNTSSGYAGLDILFVDHVHAVGVNVRNAQFGIRCFQCHGSAGAPIRLASNTVTQIGHSGIVFAGHWSTHAPSSHGLIEDNVISATGVIHAAYGEGIYLGYGSTEWADVTSDVVVRGNDISATGAEGVDIKPGTRTIEVRDNYIHDLAPISGGAISAHYVNAVANPHPSQLDSVLIEGNRIWNINLSSTPGSNDWAIWVGHGGVDVIDNVIWGLRDDHTSTRAVRVRATQDFGPHPIRIEDNTFWTTRGWMAEGTPTGAANVAAATNLGTEATTSETTVDASAFVGPVPALGVSGSANSGGGPGSAFSLAVPATTTTAPSTTTTMVPLSTTAAPTSSTTTTPSSSTTAPPSSSTTTTTTPSSTTTVSPSSTTEPVSSPSTTAGTASPSTTTPATVIDPPSTTSPDGSSTPPETSEDSQGIATTTTATTQPSLSDSTAVPTTASPAPSLTTVPSSATDHDHGRPRPTPAGRKRRAAHDPNVPPGLERFGSPTGRVEYEPGIASVDVPTLWPGTSGTEAIESKPEPSTADDGSFGVSGQQGSEAGAEGSEPEGLAFEQPNPEEAVPASEPDVDPLQALRSGLSPSEPEPSSASPPPADQDQPVAASGPVGPGPGLVSGGVDSGSSAPAGDGRRELALIGLIVGLVAAIGLGLKRKLSTTR